MARSGDSRRARAQLHALEASARDDRGRLAGRIEERSRCRRGACGRDGWRTAAACVDGAVDGAVAFDHAHANRSAAGGRSARNGLRAVAFARQACGDCRKHVGQPARPVVFRTEVGNGRHARVVSRANGAASRRRFVRADRQHGPVRSRPRRGARFLPCRQHESLARQVSGIASPHDGRGAERLHAAAKHDLTLARIVVVNIAVARLASRRHGASSPRQSSPCTTTACAGAAANAAGSGQDAGGGDDAAESHRAIFA